jgi:hypothetical protein
MLEVMLVMPPLGGALAGCWVFCASASPHLSVHRAHRRSVEAFPVAILSTGRNWKQSVLLIRLFTGLKRPRWLHGAAF